MSGRDSLPAGLVIAGTLAFLALAVVPGQLDPGAAAVTYTAMTRWGTHGDALYLQLGSPPMADFDALMSVYPSIAEQNARRPGYWSSGPDYTGADQAAYWLQRYCEEVAR